MNETEKAQLCDFIGQRGHWPSWRHLMKKQPVQVERWNFVLHETLLGNRMFIDIIIMDLMLFRNFC